MRVLLLTGPPGSGKTATLTALMNRLEADDVRHAAVELEALALVYPWPDDDAAFEHLHILSRSFERRGYPLLLVSATVPDEASLARLKGTLACQVLHVRLEARPEVLRGRISAREPPDWVGLPRLLRAAGDLAATSARLPEADVVLDTEAMSVDEAASAIRARLDPQ